jgi:hypothetical protein
MRMKYTKVMAVTFSLLLMASGSLFARSESNPRAMAMAGAYTALSTGVEAALYNPANLGLSKNPTLSMKLMGFGIKMKNSSFSLSDYNKYNGQFLDDHDKAVILSKIPNEGIDLILMTEAGGLSFSRGQMALSFRTYAASKFSLDKDPIELLLYGNAYKSEVRLDGTKGEAIALWDGALAYGYPLKQWRKGELAIGATLHYLYGIAYQKIIHTEGGIATPPEGIVGDGIMVVRSGHGGNGLTIDLGLSMIFENDWTFSASWQNFYSQINWSGRPEETTLTFDIAPLNFDNIAGENSDSLVQSSDTTYAVAPFSSKLPTIFRFGLARDYEKLTWEIDWEQATSSRAAYAVTPRLAGGIEYGLVNYLPVRAGMAFGGDRGSVYSAGFGLLFGKYYLDMAFATNGALYPGATKGAYFAVSLGLEI